MSPLILNQAYADFGGTRVLGPINLSVQPGEHIELASVLETCIDKNILQDMSKYINNFKQKFSWDNFVDGIESLYNQL